MSPLLVIAMVALHEIRLQARCQLSVRVRVTSYIGHQQLSMPPDADGPVYEPLSMADVDDLLLLYTSAGSRAALEDAVRCRLRGFIANLEQARADDAFRLASFEFRMWRDEEATAKLRRKLASVPPA